MTHGFDAESQDEDIIGVPFPDDSTFHDLAEGQSRPSLGEVNGGGTGHLSLTNTGDRHLHTLPSYNYSGDPTLLHQQFSHPSSAAGFYDFQYPNTLTTAPYPPRQDPQQTDIFADEVEDNVPTPHSGLSSFPSIVPAPSSSHIVRRRRETSHRTHASGSTIDHFDHVQGGQHDAPSAVGYGPSRRRGRHDQRRTGSSISSSVTSAPGRHHPYARPDGYMEPGHGISSLSPLDPAHPVGLQPVPSGSSHQKLSPQEYDLRRRLIQAESWLKTQTEEPAITDTDVFVIREYISTTDRTRFSAFVGTIPYPKRVACRIPHDITAEGETVVCTYNAANAKEVIAHVALFFDYEGYKCQSKEPGHMCNKMFPTPERRNDHHAKVKKGRDTPITCSICGKTALERNMARHMRTPGCRAASVRR